mgnify:CR=1 FL=1
MKKVIFSGPKTIVLWADGTKTIVSCGAGDTYDYYTGFCAAVVKEVVWFHYPRQEGFG